MAAVNRNIFLSVCKYYNVFYGQALWVQLRRHAASLYLPTLSSTGRNLVAVDSANLNVINTFRNQLQNRCLTTQSTAVTESETTPVSDVVVQSADAELDKLYRSIEIECRGAEPAVLRSYHKFITATSHYLQITIDHVEFPRYHPHRLTLLKSVFINKKHRVQYEIRTHFLIMKFLRLTSSTADTFLEYIQRNLPEGVSMKVTTEELCRLPTHVRPSEKVSPIQSK